MNTEQAIARLMGVNLYVWSVCAGSGDGKEGHAYDGFGHGHGFFGSAYDTGNGFGAADFNDERSSGLGCGRCYGHGLGHGFGCGFGYVYGEGESNDL
jgi:hypothetical protein